MSIPMGSVINGHINNKLADDGPIDYLSNGTARLSDSWLEGQLKRLDQRGADNRNHKLTT